MHKFSQISANIIPTYLNFDQNRCFFREFPLKILEFHGFHINIFKPDPQTEFVDIWERTSKPGAIC